MLKVKVLFITYGLYSKKSTGRIKNRKIEIYINKLILEYITMEEKSSFRLVFGDSPIVKVIDFFLDNREFGYSLTDITKNVI